MPNGLAPRLAVRFWPMLAIAFSSHTRARREVGHWRTWQKRDRLSVSPDPTQKTVDATGRCMRTSMGHQPTLGSPRPAPNHRGGRC